MHETTNAEGTSTVGKQALLVGVTGLVGRELLHELLAAPEYDRVIALVRRDVLNVKHKKFQVNVIDFSRMDIPEKWLSGASVFCTVGTTIRKVKTQEAFRSVDLDIPVRLAEQAASKGADQFLIVTAMGADRNSRIFYNRVKGEVEHRLGEMGLGCLHIFRPSLLLGDRREFRLGERIAAFISRGLRYAMVGPLRKYRPIHARTVAKGMLAAAMTSASGVHIHESDQIESLAALRT